MSIERNKEIRKRRKRAQKYAHYKARLDKMDAPTKEKLKEKLRKMTTGAEDLIKAWGL